MTKRDFLTLILILFSLLLIGFSVWNIFYQMDYASAQKNASHMNDFWSWQIELMLNSSE